MNLTFWPYRRGKEGKEIIMEKIIQITPKGHLLYALCLDGKVYELIEINMKKSWRLIETVSMEEILP